MSAKTQIEKEIREAVVFLREHNHTIPSETIEYMKQASLSQLEVDFKKKSLSDWDGDGPPWDGKMD